MNSPLFISAASRVTEADLADARLGPRSGRLDLQSRLALLAVDSLGLDFQAWAGRRVGISLAAAAASLATDYDYWQGRNAVGGPSPTLFAYTLPSAAIGELAIRFHLTGPNLCFVGDNAVAVSEGAGLVRRGEAEGCICVGCEVVSAELAKLLQAQPAAGAYALFLEPGHAAAEPANAGKIAARRVKLPDFPRDMQALHTLFCCG